MTDPPHPTGFTTLGEEALFAGRVVSFNRVRVRAPDGHEFDREILRHPGVVVVVPLHDDGTVTLVRQYRVAIGQELLELPAGTRDVVGEPTVVAAARELAEEAGLAAQHLEELVTYFAAPGGTDESIVVFIARGLQEVPTDRQGPEEHAMTIERIPLDVALQMIDDGQITDAKTIIGLTLAARRR
ncbi:MAG: NUDIX domain-containing protein [Acidimicrobiales bacterium]